MHCGRFCLVLDECDPDCKTENTQFLFPNIQDFLGAIASDTVHQTRDNQIDTAIRSIAVKFSFG